MREMQEIETLRSPLLVSARAYRGRTPIWSSFDSELTSKLSSTSSTLCRDEAHGSRAFLKTQRTDERSCQNASSPETVWCNYRIDGKFKVKVDIDIEFRIEFESESEFVQFGSVQFSSVQFSSVRLGLLLLQFNASLYFSTRPFFTTTFQYSRTFSCTSLRCFRFKTEYYAIIDGIGNPAQPLIPVCFPAR
jgi:hypothetical protein